MKKHSRRMAVMAAALFLSACSHMPQWSSMGPDYEPINSEVAALAAPADPALVNTAALPPLACRTAKGAALFGRQWQDYKPADAALVAGERVTMPLQPVRGAGRAGIVAFFDAEGQKLIFCPDVQGPPTQKIACTSLYALEDDLKQGIKRTFDVPDAVRGGQIGCAFSPERIPAL